MLSRSFRGFIVLILAFTGVLPLAGVAAGDEAEPVLSTVLPLDSVVPGTDISGLGGVQYRNNNQRNFWWNAIAQRWDGILPTASPPATASSQWWVWHDLGGANPRPIAQFDPSQSSTPDAFWHESSRTLYVFFSRGNSGTSRFRRYFYDANADRYIEVSRTGGVPAPDMLRGGSRVTIIRSPNGHLWAGVNYEGKIRISRSTDNGDTWAAPVEMKSTAMPGEGHWVLLNVGGATHVGFAATEDGLAPGGNARVHFLHLNQDEPNWTSYARWTDETSLLPPWEGDERADDELSAVTFENRAFIVIETEPLGDARSARRPQLLVFERRADGSWTKHVILRYTSKGVNDAKRPVVTVDASSRSLVVTGGSTTRLQADMWYAPIDSLAGRDEQWSQLRIFEASNPATQDIYNTRLPLPRFPVSADANLLTMIDDRGAALNLWRQLVRPAGVTEPPPDPSVTVSMTSPTGGSIVAGTVQLQATATNAVSVEFLCVKDGVTQRIGLDEDPSDGWFLPWDTTKVADGSYQLSAVATAQSGVTATSDPVIINVNNSGGEKITTLDIPIATTDDDVEERSNGRIWTSQSNLDLMNDVGSAGTDVQRAVGLRFTGVDIPRGVNIARAYIQFQADKATDVATALTITGHAADDATPFGLTRYEVSARARTSASVDWDPPAWPRRGDRTAQQRTADLAPILQELTSRTGWTAGNAVSLIIEGVGERVVTSFDSGLFAPTLHVEYRVPAPPGPGDENSPPVVTSVAINQSAPRTNDTLTSTVAASDPDGDPVTYSYQWLRNGAAISGATAASLDLATGAGNKGDRMSLRVTASDGKASSAPVTSAEVTVVNSPPTFNQVLSDRSSSIGDTVSLSAAATDPDQDPLTYAATGLPAGLSINPSTGLISGTIGGSATTYTVSVTVTDGTISTAQGPFTWTVAANDPPGTPGGLALTSTSTEVVLDWADSPEPDLAGYHVYRSAAADGTYTRLTGSLLTQSAYTDADAPPGQSHYRVTAVDAAGQESPAAQTSVTGRIVLRATSSSTARNTNTITVARPAGTASGDVLVAAVSASGSGTLSTPQGWALVRADTSGSTIRQAVFVKVAGDSEPTSYAFGMQGNASIAAVVGAYRGVSTASPVEVAGGQGNGSSLSITAPSVTTAAANRLLLGFFGVTSTASNGITPPEQMVERADVTQGQGNPKLILEAADQVLGPAGATGSRVATVSSAGANVGQLVVLRPAL